MRFFSIISAILVVIALYLLVFDRERVFAFAGRDSGTIAEEEGVPAVPVTRRHVKICVITTVYPLWRSNPLLKPSTAP